MFEEQIVAVAKALAQPAGEKFDSHATIAADHEAFVVACHDTWKALHMQAVEELFKFEGFLKAEKQRPLGPAVEELGLYNAAVWRRVNDAIAWSLVGGQRHLIKRLCLYKPPAALLEANPSAALSTLSDLNANPLSVALWTDATSCVDVGDVMYVKDGRRPVPQFIELKEGEVNRHIIALLDLSEEGLDAALPDFIERYGQMGAKQFDRVRRQHATAEQALHLLNHDEGIDPITGLHMEVREASHAPETYDTELQAVLDQALDDPKPTISLIDGCLWVYADAVGDGWTSGTRFAAELERCIPGFSVETVSRRHRLDHDRLWNFAAHVHQHMAKPIYLRNLSARLIGSTTYGRLQRGVWLYIDWDAFGRLVEECGGRFDFTSAKHAARMQTKHPKFRLPIIRGGHARISSNGGETFITHPNLVEIFGSGLRPTALIKMMMGQLDELAAEAT